MQHHISKSINREINIATFIKEVKNQLTQCRLENTVTHENTGRKLNANIMKYLISESILAQTVVILQRSWQPTK